MKESVGAGADTRAKGRTDVKEQGVMLGFGEGAGSANNPLNKVEAAERVGEEVYGVCWVVRGSMGKCRGNGCKLSPKDC